MSVNVQRMRNVQFGELIEFMAVAEYLGVSTPTLSQAIRSVEERLGLRLLNRTTRQVAATAVGERLIERLHPVMTALECALEELNEYRETPVGCLRLAVAPAASHVLGAVLARFLNRYPDIRIELFADGGRFDLTAGRYDAGIQLGRQVADTMVAVRVSPDIRYAVVGAPGYFARHPAPQTPQELSAHNCIRLRGHCGKIDAWQFVRGDDEFSVPVDGAIVLDDLELALRTALSGGGLVYLPGNRADRALAAGALQEVLQGWMPRPAEGFVLCYPSRRQNPAALRCLVDILRENLRGERPDAAAVNEPRLLSA